MPERAHERVPKPHPNGHFFQGGVEDHFPQRSSESRVVMHMTLEADHLPEGTVPSQPLVDIDDNSGTSLKQFE